MNLRPLLLCSALLLGGTLAPAAQTILAVGTYQQGSNITEPRPKQSEYLETLHGGVAVVGPDACYYLFTKVIKHPEKELYITVEYEDPAGGKPFVNDAPFQPADEELHFSSPQFVKGLKSYGDYTIVVRVFAAKEAAEPLDTLKQTVRSYVDTRGPKAKLFKRLKAK